MTATVRAVAALISAVLAFSRGDAATDPPRPSEYAVKAAFMYNFAKFVDWPADPARRGPFIVGVLGDDPFGVVLDRTLAGKKVQDRPLVVKRMIRVDDVGEADLLFVSSSEDAKLAQILGRLEGSPTLTVGDMDDFIGRGGMVGFHLEQESVRFDINLDRVWQSHLKMSSQLVRVARKVISTKTGH
jgi:hypothetical protein